MNNLLLVPALLVFSCYPSTAWWPFSSSSQPQTAEQPEQSGKHLEKSPVPFEMTAVEEKFLQEARQYMGDLSPLDACHQIVIKRIRKSCGDVNEEELGKLGVALLNCQSKAEGRPTFPCTEEMALAECTLSMDASTWNSYHIISNRARSLCYATRQQQFRLKTEYTVNELAKQAGNQLQLMETLKEGQSELSDLAVSTVQKVTAGQDSLIRQQRHLKNSYHDVQRSISTSMRANLDELSQEKALINEGKKALGDMTKSITEKLENATNEIRKQGNDRAKNHQQILDDLENVRRKAFEVWTRIDDSTSQMSSYHVATEHHYEETLENLRRMNNTIFLLLQTLSDMENKVDSRLTWLAESLGGTGNKLAMVSTCVMHAGYFLVATLSVLFVSAPLFTRLALLVLVPVNAWHEIKFGSSLSFASLTILVTTALVGNWIFVCVQRRLARPAVAQLCARPADNSFEFARTAPSSNQATPNASAYNTITSEGSLASVASVSRSFLEETIPSPVTDPERHLGDTRRLLNLSLPASFSTPNKRQCGSLTKTGSACKKSAVKGRSSCSVHSRMKGPLSSGNQNEDSFQC